MLYWLHNSRGFGGAELDNRSMLDAAPLPVKEVYPDTFNREEIDGGVVIMGASTNLKSEDLVWLVKTQKYIKYERDYAFCKWRHATEHDCREKCRDELRFQTRVFKNSLLNIFASPAQAEVYLKYMPLDKSKIRFVPSPIDVDRFYYNGPKEEFYLAVVVAKGGWAKGLDLMRQNFPGLIVLGWEHKIPYKDIHTWYHKAKYFVHTPRWIDPCPRTIGEAFCAHCELITNNNIGWYSYDWWGDKNETYSQMRNAPEKFWEIIYECGRNYS